jgi:hypothetical protein
MSRQEDLIRDDDTTGLVGGEGAQTSNKEGKQSSARKPSNSGPDSHEEHKAPVAGAFGNKHNRDKVEQQDTYLGDIAPKDKALRKR